MLLFRYNLSANKNTPKGEIPKMSLALNCQKRNSFSSLNTKATFDNDTVSGNLSVTYFQAFLKKIGLSEVLDTCITYEKHHNSTFNPVEIINFMINATVLGYSRFTHMDMLRKDKVFCDIMDDKIPSEKVCRDLLLDFPKGQLPNFVGQIKRPWKSKLQLKRLAKSC